MKSTSHFAQIPLAIALVLGISASLGGCAAEADTSGNSTETSQTDQGTATDSGEKAPAEDANSKGFIDPDGEVPDWVADGFPIYPGSEVAGYDEYQGTTMISFFVPDPDEQAIYEWFVEQYSQNGWEPRNLDAEHGSFDADNADGRKASINVTGSTFAMTAEKE